MNTALIQFAVQSIVRLKVAGTEAAEQRARNRPALLPHLDLSGIDRRLVVDGFFNNTAEHKAQVAPGGALAEFWDSTKAKPDKVSVDSLYVAALKISAEEGVDLAAALTPAGAVLIEQFEPGDEPASPFARIALTAADIVFEYLAINPGIASDDPNSQKLIGAFAENMATFLPDNGDFGLREKFGQRLAAGFLRAGIATVSAHPDWVVDENHIQQFLEDALQPVVDKFPASIADRIQWSEVTEAIVGPAAQAALETIAAHQAEFFGARLASDQALGAVTQAVLLHAAENGLRKPFERDNLIGLYRAVLGIAATRPELFIKGNAPNDAVAREMLGALSNALASSPAPFDRQAGLALASAAIEVVGANAHRFADPAADWHVAAVKVFEGLTSEFAASIRTNGNLKLALSKEQFTEIGRIVLTEVSANPTLITTSDEWHGVIKAISKAMAADTKLLLTAGDWKVIAAVAAQEAARNPGRLFGLSQGQQGQLAGRLITAFLKGANDALRLNNGAARSVLVGSVLREAINIAVQAASGNVQAVSDHFALIEELIAELNELAVEHHLEIGSKEWLHLFRAFLGSALDGTRVGDLTLERAVALLQGA